MLFVDALGDHGFQNHTFVGDNLSDSYVRCARIHQRKRRPAPDAARISKIGEGQIYMGRFEASMPPMWSSLVHSDTDV